MSQCSADSLSELMLNECGDRNDASLFCCSCELSV